MRHTTANRIIATTAATALMLTLVPAPALAEVADKLAADELAMTADEPVATAGKPQTGTDELASEVAPAIWDAQLSEDAGDATAPASLERETANPEEQEQAEASLEQSDDGMPVMLYAQASSDDKGWTSEDSRKLSSVFLNVGMVGVDIGMILLGAGNPALAVGGANNLMGDIMGWMGLGASTGPTMSDVAADLDSIQYRLNDMDKRLGDVEYGVDIANVRSLIESANDLATYCSEVEQMFDSDHLAKLGMQPLPANASPEQTNAWRERVVQAIIAAEHNRTDGFIQYESDMTHIKQLFVHVANIASQPSATNPIPVWDSLWENYYNWETEAWGPKQALRTSVATSLTRSYGLLAMYLRIYEDPDHVETTLTSRLQSALRQVSSMGAGTNPATIDLAKGGFSVRCYTLNRCATKWKATCYVNEGISGVTDAQVKDYLSRLHGHTVLEDLQLAGLAGDLAVSGGNVVTKRYSTKVAGDRGDAGLPVAGLAYKGDWSDDGSRYGASILSWDGKTSAKTTVTGTNTAGGTYFLNLGLV